MHEAVLTFIVPLNNAW